MKERPIIFSGESVRAILGGRKTQTRRVMKPQPVYVPECRTILHSLVWQRNGKKLNAAGGPYGTNLFVNLLMQLTCPHGVPGDRLWVRETWTMDLPGRNVLYRADSETLADGNRWRSPIYLPRSASRIILELTGVRGERVQDISTADAIAEGFGLPEGEMWPPHFTLLMKESWPRQQFCDYFDSLNAKRGYSVAPNPWNWVLEFKRRD